MLTTSARHSFASCDIGILINVCVDNTSDLAAGVKDSQNLEHHGDTTVAGELSVTSLTSNALQLRITTDQFRNNSWARSRACTTITTNACNKSG
jgi:hypothetical protein